MVYIFSTFSPEGGTYELDVNHIDGRKLLNDGYCMVMLNGHHRRLSVKMLSSEDGVEYAAEAMCMRHTFWVEGKPISPTKAIKPSKV